MNRGILLLLVLSLSATVRSADLNEFQKKAYSEMSKFLTEEGFTPSIDDSDGTLNFKKEGVLHWIYVQKDKLFITVNRSGFKLGGEDGYIHEKAIYAANTVNRDLNVVKIYCTENSAKVTYELYARSVEDFKFVFYTSLTLLSSARETFLETYSSENKATSGSITVVDIQVANTDKESKIISKFGEAISSQKSMYIKPNVTITSKVTGKYTLYVKFITPSGLSTSSSSPSGYSYKQDVSLTDGKTESFGFSGWGGEKAGHWKAGTYKWEFWYDGICIGSKEFKIL